MKEILSRDNPRFKALRRLAESARARREEGGALLDGWHLLEAYARAGGVPQRVVFSRSSLASGQAARWLAGAGGGIETLVLADGLFAALSPVASPTGVLAQIALPFGVPLRSVRFGVLLDDVQDPGNLGAILRSAAAAGCDGAYLSPGCADAWSPKTLRAGMGAHFVLPIAEDADLVAVARAFAGKVLATSLDGGEPLYDLDLRGPVVFVVGNEGAGVGAEILAAASHRVKIPMPGAVESLNAAAAVAVCLFERVRQTDWQQSSAGKNPV
jgi:TrmH family RNA methyltransferase